MVKSNYENVKEWRKNNPDKLTKLRNKGNKKYYHKYPGRHRFSKKVCRLLKTKSIRRHCCIVCGGATQLEACTESVSPSDPLWFCSWCHKQFHKDLKI